MHHRGSLPPTSLVLHDANGRRRWVRPACVLAIIRSGLDRHPVRRSAGDRKRILVGVRHLLSIAAIHACGVKPVRRVLPLIAEPLGGGCGRRTLHVTELVHEGRLRMLHRSNALHRATGVDVCPRVILPWRDPHVPRVGHPATIHIRRSVLTEARGFASRLGETLTIPLKILLRVVAAPIIRRRASHHRLLWLKSGLPVLRMRHRHRLLRIAGHLHLPPVVLAVAPARRAEVLVLILRIRAPHLLLALPHTKGRCPGHVSGVGHRSVPSLVRHARPVAALER
mmetsp:Transcript_16095/g.61404  ORF Transcript_16095/g.61404 Transcript_16095/m.61404 type:complete len:282 (-) Transcript_16095:530-1375(-)